MSHSFNPADIYIVSSKTADNGITVVEVVDAHDEAWPTGEVCHLVGPDGEIIRTLLVGTHSWERLSSYNTILGDPRVEKIRAIKVLRGLVCRQRGLRWCKEYIERLRGCKD